MVHGIGFHTKNGGNCHNASGPRKKSCDET